MPPRHLVRAFMLLWWVVGAVVFYLSVQTVRAALAPGDGGPDLHAIAIGAVEAGAALLFLVPRTLRLGTMVLLATFAVAFVLHALKGHFAAPLLVYAAAILFVMIHGPAPATAAPPVGAARA